MGQPQGRVGEEGGCLPQPLLINPLASGRFRLVPFLVELRAVMDWVWTDTTLSLSNWMCVEDIYANIFIIKCSRETEKVPGPKAGVARGHWSPPTGAGGRCENQQLTACGHLRPESHQGPESISRTSWWPEGTS